MRGGLVSPGMDGMPPPMLDGTPVPKDVKDEVMDAGAEGGAGPDVPVKAGGGGAEAAAPDAEPQLTLEMGHATLKGAFHPNEDR